MESQSRFRRLHTSEPNEVSRIRSMYTNNIATIQYTYPTDSQTDMFVKIKLPVWKNIDTKVLTIESVAQGCLAKKDLLSSSPSVSNAKRESGVLTCPHCQHCFLTK